MVEKVQELVAGAGEQGEEIGRKVQRGTEGEKGKSEGGDLAIKDAEVKFARLCALLRIGTSCQALLDVVAEEVITLGKQLVV